MALTEAEKKALNSVLTVRRGDTIPNKELKFIWNSYIPAGEITLLYGNSGVGKSMVCCKIAADISKGTELPGGSLKKPGKVLYIGSDLTDSDIAYRVIHSGGNAKNVYLHSAMVHYPSCDLLGNDLDKLQQLVDKLRPNLIIVDDCYSFMQTLPQPITAMTIQKQWTEWLHLCKHKDCGLILVAPVNKQSLHPVTSDDPTGIVLYNLSKSVLHVVSDVSDDEDDICAVVHQKANYSVECPSLILHAENDTFTWKEYSVLTKSVLDYATLHKCPVSTAVHLINTKEESES